MARSLHLERVTVILFDVDGVLTDGRVVLGSEGFEAKFFDAKDGHRIKMASRAGVKVFFVTGRRSVAVERRAAELGASGVYQGVADKGALLGELCGSSGATPEQMAYMGDDLVDIPLMRLVGCAACPADAAAEVLERADLVVDLPGGRGAAGRFVEMILKARGDWDGLVERYVNDGL